MAKKLHLICNAHLDPVWQWEWEEGAAEALSTFRIAADFCEEYDNFVFCHNEALLYKWIEQYDAPLFERIVRLVKEDKWHIMGGWHLQPDCNMPSGEAFVRQILEGRKYFLEKFGKVPTVAINLDPFGHTRGLVQIMKKSGYTGYLFMRPGSGDKFIKLPADEFVWRGYDGSEIAAVRIFGGYNSGKGRAAEKIRSYIEKCPEDDFFLCLWGIGNHGGGPSKKDLDDIVELTKECADSGVELIHSTPEKYFAEVTKKHTLPTFDKSLNAWAVGCYTSQIRVKQKYRETENLFFETEIMASHAQSEGLMSYPEKDFAEAIYDIITVQFHDMLPGSSVRSAEEMIFRMLDHASEILSRIRAQAFFALASGQKKAPSDKIPVFAYNPHPYPVTGDFMCEFMLWDQYYGNEFYKPTLYDENGNIVPTQCEKENSTIPIEWRKRIVFNTTLSPMSMNRFECAFSLVPERPEKTLPHDGLHYIYDGGEYHIEINRKTGLIDKLERLGVNYLSENAFEIEVFEDNYDPWRMDCNGWKDKIGAFTLLSEEQAQILCHTNEKIDAVHIIESGSIRTVVEAVFGYNTSRAVARYYLSAKEGLRVDIRIVNDEKQKLYKLNIPAAFAVENAIGEHAYGAEELNRGIDRESVAQKYVLMTGSESALCVFGNSGYGCSFDDERSELKLTLMRSPSYTAHPIDGKTVMPQDRFMPYIDQGERDFSFSLAFGGKEELQGTVGRLAVIKNMPPMLLSFFPTGEGKKPSSPAYLSGDTVCMTALKKADVGEGYIIRLFNPTDKKTDAVFSFRDSKTSLSFGAFEIKTLRYDGEKLSETDLMEGLLDGSER